MNKEISDIIINRIKEKGRTFFANENISEYLHSNELDKLETEVQEKVESLLKSLIIDTYNDHNTKETAKRVAKMYIREIFKGRYFPKPKITDFPNFKNMDELYILGPINFKSCCSHHFVEISGKCFIGIKPSDRVVGISKIARIVDWIARRPNIQEEATIIIADELEKLLNPVGLGVVIKSKHHCMTWRGVEEDDCNMITSVMRGDLLNNPNLKHEFFNLINDSLK